MKYYERNISSQKNLAEHMVGEDLLSAKELHAEGR
jgi:hypothetical protein